MNPQAIQAALAQAEHNDSVRAVANLLRTQLAPLRVVVVDAADMRDETPALRTDRHAVYWGASDGHCWAVTADPARAVGLFIAAVH
jgi:hypothetical protein